MSIVTASRFIRSHSFTKKNAVKIGVRSTPTVKLAWIFFGRQRVKLQKFNVGCVFMRLRRFTVQ